MIHRKSFLVSHLLSTLLALVPGPDHRTFLLAVLLMQSIFIKSNHPMEFRCLRHKFARIYLPVALRQFMRHTLVEFKSNLCVLKHQELQYDPLENVHHAPEIAHCSFITL